MPRVSLRGCFFVLTVVIFHMVFNHIVITKPRDHFLPHASLHRVLGCDCAELFAQTCPMECAVSDVQAHTQRLRVSLCPGKAVMEAQGTEFQGRPCQKPLLHIRLCYRSDASESM